MRRLSLVAILVIAACSQARRADPATITRVELRLLPATGRAWVSFEAGGKTRGGHFSGDNPPMVHLDTATTSGDSVQAIFAAVRAIGDSLLARRGPAVDSSRAGTATLAVTYSDSTQAQVVWAGTAQPPAAIQTALEHVLANRIGGW